MRDASSEVESYHFEIANPFDRGALVGGFGYIEFEDKRRNRLVMMSKAQMDKRKPAKASGNFWGKWEDEMYLKTLARHVYSSKFIRRDPMKIDDAYQSMKLREARIAKLEAAAIVQANANGELLDTAPIAPVLTPSAAQSLPAGQNVSPVDTATGEVRQVPASDRSGQTVPAADTVSAAASAPGGADEPDF